MNARFRQKPCTEGVWERVGRKHYQHVAGPEVLYRHNDWLWEIVGTASDGERFSTLSAAQARVNYLLA